MLILSDSIDFLQVETTSRIKAFRCAWCNRVVFTFYMTNRHIRRQQNNTIPFHQFNVSQQSVCFGLFCSVIRRSPQTKRSTAASMASRGRVFPMYCMYCTNSKSFVRQEAIRRSYNTSTFAYLKHFFIPHLSTALNWLAVYLASVKSATLRCYNNKMTTSEYWHILGCQNAPHSTQLHHIWGLGTRIKVLSFRTMAWGPRLSPPR